ncbi:MAG: transcriptional regulator [Hyphomicrobiales bacterium]|nr:MAG: transcriptional regulator [Hyphomicrobiales bacterium]
MASYLKTSDSTALHGDRRVLDITNYIPYFLAAVNNPLSRGASKIYLKKFNLGIVEWRVIAMLAIEPCITASRICDVVALDKAATSRALTRLLVLGYLEFSSKKSDVRRKKWSLNEAGYSVHDQILRLALQREEKLIEGIPPEDTEIFLRVIRMMHKNVDALS